MTSQPEHPSVAPRKLQVRRAPKYVPFLIAGGLVGILVAAILAFSFAADEEFAATSVFGLFAVLMVVPGMGLGAVAALILDRQGRRRAKTLVAQELPDDDNNQTAGTI